MPNISNRGRTMPPSPIRKLVPFAEEAKRQGKHVYHINIGQPDIETPAVMMDAFREHDLKILPYGHSAGLWEYRDELVKYYARFGIEIRSDQIIVTTGGSEAIVFALMAVADHGDEVIIPEPFYTNYNGFAVEAGVDIVPVTCHVEDGFRLPAMGVIEAKIGPRTRAIMVCSPNNPTGYVLTEEEFAGLAALAVKHDLFLFADEVYREFVYDGAVARSVLTLPGIEDRAVMLDSISKRYSACGARVGAIVTRNQAVLDACLRLGQARLCPPTLEQLAAARAVHTPAEYFEKVLAEYLARRDAVFEGLARIPGAVAAKPSGAFYTVVRLPIADADAFCRFMLSDFDLDGETVMLAPANGFYATPGLGRDEVRIAFVLNVESMHRSMEILRQGLLAYPG
jgi:aspartate aminotransferase